jgi:hypothetical protein
MTDDSQRPFKISERRPISMPALVLVALLCGAASFGVGYASLLNRTDKILDQTQADGRSIAHLQSRVDTIEQQRADMGVLQNDVNWIKQTLLQMRQDLKRQP